MKCRVLLLAIALLGFISANDLVLDFVTNGYQPGNNAGILMANTSATEVSLIDKVGVTSQSIECRSIEILFNQDVDYSSRNLRLHGSAASATKGIQLESTNIDLLNLTEGRCSFLSSDDLDLFIEDGSTIDICVTGAHSVTQMGAVQVLGGIKIGDERNPTDGPIKVAVGYDLLSFSLEIFTSSQVEVVSGSGFVGSPQIREEEFQLAIHVLYSAQNKTPAVQIGQCGNKQSSISAGRVLVDFDMNQTQNSHLSICSVETNELILIGNDEVITELSDIKFMGSDPKMVMKDVIPHIAGLEVAEGIAFNIFYDISKQGSSLTVNDMLSKLKGHSVNILFHNTQINMLLDGQNYKTSNSTDLAPIKLSNSASLYGLVPTNQFSPRLLSLRAETKEFQPVNVSFRDQDSVKAETLVESFYDIAVSFPDFTSATMTNFTFTLKCNSLFCKKDTVPLKYKGVEDSIFKLSSNGTVLTALFKFEDFGVGEQDYGAYSFEASGTYIIDDVYKGTQVVPFNCFIFKIGEITSKIVTREDSFIDLNIKINYINNCGKSELDKYITTESKEPGTRLECIEDLCTYKDMSSSNANSQIIFGSSRYEGKIKVGITKKDLFTDFTVEASGDYMVFVLEGATSDPSNFNPMYAYFKLEDKKSAKQTLNKMEGTQASYRAKGFPWMSSEKYDEICMEKDEITMCHSLRDDLKPKITEMTITNLNKKGLNKDVFLTNVDDLEKVLHLEIVMDSLTRIVADKVTLSGNIKEGYSDCIINNSGSGTSKTIECDIKTKGSGDLSISAKLPFDLSATKTIRIEVDSVRPTCSPSRRCVFMQDIYQTFTPIGYTTPDFRDGHSLIIGDPKSVTYEIRNPVSQYGISEVTVMFQGIPGKLNIPFDKSTGAPKHVSPIIFDIFDLFPGLTIPEGLVLDMKVILKSYSGLVSTAGNTYIHVLRNPSPEIHSMYGYGELEYISGITMRSRLGFKCKPCTDENISYGLLSHHYTSSSSPLKAYTYTGYEVKAVTGKYEKFYNFLSSYSEYYSKDSGAFVKTQYVVGKEVVGISYEKTLQGFGMSGFSFIESTVSDVSYLDITPIPDSLYDYAMKLTEPTLRLGHDDTWSECSEIDSFYRCKLVGSSNAWDGTIEFTNAGSTLVKVVSHADVSSVHPCITSVIIEPKDVDSDGRYLYEKSNVRLIFTLAKPTSFFPGHFKLELVNLSSDNIDVVEENRAAFGNTRTTNYFNFEKLIGGRNLAEKDESLKITYMDAPNKDFCNTMAPTVFINHLEPDFYYKNTYTGKEKTQYMTTVNGDINVFENYFTCNYRYFTGNSVIIGSSPDYATLLLGPFNTNNNKYIKKWVNGEDTGFSDYIECEKGSSTCGVCTYDNNTAARCNERCIDSERCCEVCYHTHPTHYYLEYKINDLVKDIQEGHHYSFQVQPYGMSKIPGYSVSGGFIWFNYIESHIALTDTTYEHYYTGVNNTESRYNVTHSNYVFWGETSLSPKGEQPSLYCFSPYPYDKRPDVVYSVLDWNYFSGFEEQKESRYRKYRVLSYPIGTDEILLSFSAWMSFLGSNRPSTTEHTQRFEDFNLNEVGPTMKFYTGSCEADGGRIYMSLRGSNYTAKCSCTSNVVSCTNLVYPHLVSNYVTVTLHPISITKDFPNLWIDLVSSLPKITKSTLNEKPNSDLFYFKEDTTFNFNLYFNGKKPINSAEFSYEATVKRKGSLYSLPQSSRYSETDHRDGDGCEHEFLHFKFDNPYDLLKKGSKDGDVVQITFSGGYFSFDNLPGGQIERFNLLMDLIEPRCYSSYGYIGPYGTCIYVTDSINDFVSRSKKVDDPIHFNVLDPVVGPRIAIGPIQFRSDALEKILVGVYDGNELILGNGGKPYEFFPSQIQELLSLGTVQNEDGFTLINIVYLVHLKDVNLGSLAEGKMYTIKVQGVNKAGVISADVPEMKLDFVVDVQDKVVEHFFVKIDKTESPDSITVTGTSKAYQGILNNEGKTEIISKTYAAQIFCGGKFATGNTVKGKNDLFPTTFDLSCDVDSLIQINVGYIIDFDTNRFFRGTKMKASKDITLFKGFGLSGNLVDGRNLLNARLTFNIPFDKGSNYQNPKIRFISRTQTSNIGTDCDAIDVKKPNDVICRWLEIVSTWDNIVEMIFAGTTIIDTINPPDINSVVPKLIEASLNDFVLTDTFYQINSNTRLRFNFKTSDPHTEYYQGLCATLYKYDIYGEEGEENMKKRNPTASSKIVSVSVKRLSPPIPTGDLPPETTYVEADVNSMSDLITMCTDKSGFTGSIDGDYKLVFNNTSTYGDRALGAGSFTFYLRVDDTRPNCTNGGRRCVFTSQAYNDFAEGKRYKETTNILFDQIYVDNAKLRLIVGPLFLRNRKNVGTLELSCSPERGKLPEWSPVIASEMIDVGDLEIENEEIKDNENPGFIEGGDPPNELLYYYYIDISVRLKESGLVPGVEQFLKVRATSKSGMVSEGMMEVNFVVQPLTTVTHVFNIIDNYKKLTTTEFTVSSLTKPISKEEKPKSVKTFIKRISSSTGVIASPSDKPSTIIVEKTLPFSTQFNVTIGYLDNIQGEITFSSLNKTKFQGFSMRAGTDSDSQKKNVVLDLTCAENTINCATTGTDSNFKTQVNFIQDTWFSGEGTNCTAMSGTSLKCQDLVINHDWSDGASLLFQGTKVIETVKPKELSSSIPYLTQVGLNGVSSGGLVYVSKEGALKFTFEWSTGSSSIIRSVKGTIKEEGSSQQEDLIIYTSNSISFGNDQKVTEKIYEGMGELCSTQKNGDGTYILTIDNTPTSATNGSFTFKLLRIDTPPSCVDDSIYNKCVNIISSLSSLEGQGEELKKSLSTQIISGDSLTLALGPYKNYQDGSNSIGSIDYTNLNINSMVLEASTESGEITVKRIQLENSHMKELKILECEGNECNISILYDVSSFVKTLEGGRKYKFRFDMETKSGIQTGDTFSRCFMMSPNITVEHIYDKLKIGTLPNDTLDLIPNSYSYTISGNQENGSITLCEGEGPEPKCVDSSERKFGPFESKNDPVAEKNVTLSFAGIEGKITSKSTDSTPFANLNISNFSTNSDPEKYYLLVGLGCGVQGVGCPTVNVGTNEPATMLFLDDNVENPDMELETKAGSNCYANTPTTFVCHTLNANSDWTGTILFKAQNLTLITRTAPELYNKVLPSLISVTLGLPKYGDEFYSNSKGSLVFNFKFNNKSLNYISDLKISVKNDKKTFARQTIAINSDNDKDGVVTEKFNKLLDFLGEAGGVNVDLNGIYTITVSNTMTAPSGSTPFIIKLNIDDSVPKCPAQNYTCLHFTYNEDYKVDGLVQLVSDTQSLHFLVGPLEDDKGNITSANIEMTPESPAEPSACPTLKRAFSNDQFTRQSDGKTSYLIRDATKGLVMCKGVVYTVKTTLTTKSGSDAIFTDKLFVNPQPVVNHKLSVINEWNEDGKSPVVITATFSPEYYQMNNQPSVVVHSATCGKVQMVKEASPAESFKGTCSISDLITTVVEFEGISGTLSISSKNTTFIRGFTMKSNDLSTTPSANGISGIEVSLTFESGGSSPSSGNNELLFYFVSASNTIPVSSTCSIKDSPDVYLCTKLGVTPDWSGKVTLVFGETTIKKQINPSSIGKTVPSFSKVTLNKKQSGENITIDPDTSVVFDFVMATASSECVTAARTSVFSCGTESWDDCGGASVDIMLPFNLQNTTEVTSARQIKYANIAEFFGGKNFEGGKFKLLVHNTPTCPEKDSTSLFLVELKEPDLKCKYKKDLDHPCAFFTTNTGKSQDILKDEQAYDNGWIIDSLLLEDPKLSLFVGPIFIGSDQVKQFIIRMSSGSKTKEITVDGGASEKCDSEHVCFTTNIFRVLSDFKLSKTIEFSISAVPSYGEFLTGGELELDDFTAVIVGTVSASHNFTLLNSPLEGAGNIVTININAGLSDQIISTSVKDFVCNSGQVDREGSNGGSSGTQGFRTSCLPTDSLMATVQFLNNGDLLSGKRYATSRYISMISGFNPVISKNNPARFVADLVCVLSSNCKNIENNSSVFVSMLTNNPSGEKAKSCTVNAGDILCDNLVVGSKWNNTIELTLPNMALRKKLEGTELETFLTSVPGLSQVAVNKVSDGKQIVYFDGEPLEVEVKYERKTTFLFSEIELVWSAEREGKVVAKDQKSYIDVGALYNKTLKEEDTFVFEFHSINELLNPSIPLQPETFISIEVKKKHGITTAGSLPVRIKLGQLSVSCENKYISDNNTCLFLVNTNTPVEETFDVKGEESRHIFPAETIGGVKLVVGGYVGLAVQIIDFKLCSSIIPEGGSGNTSITCEDTNKFVKYGNWYVIEPSTPLSKFTTEGVKSQITVKPIYSSGVQNKTDGDVAKVTIMRTESFAVKYSINTVNERAESVEALVSETIPANIEILGYSQTEAGGEYQFNVKRQGETELKVALDCDPQQTLIATCALAEFGEESFVVSGTNTSKFVDVDLKCSGTFAAPQISVSVLPLGSENPPKVDGTFEVSYSEDTEQDANEEEEETCPGCLARPEWGWDGFLTVWNKVEQFKAVVDSKDIICGLFPKFAVRVGDSSGGPVLLQRELDGSGYKLTISLNLNPSTVGLQVPIRYKLGEEEKSEESSFDETGSVTISHMFTEKDLEEEVVLQVFDIAPSVCSESSGVTSFVISGARTTVDPSKSFCLSLEEDNLDSGIGECVTAFDLHNYTRLSIQLVTNDEVKSASLFIMGEGTEKCEVGMTNVINIGKQQVVEFEIDFGVESCTEVLTTAKGKRVEVTADLEMKLGEVLQVNGSLFPFSGKPKFVKGEGCGLGEGMYYFAGEENKEHFEINFTNCFANTTSLAMDVEKEESVLFFDYPYEGSISLKESGIEISGKYKLSFTPENNFPGAGAAEATEKGEATLFFEKESKEGWKVKLSNVILKEAEVSNVKPQLKRGKALYLHVYDMDVGVGVSGVEKLAVDGEEKGQFPSPIGHNKNFKWFTQELNDPEATTLKVKLTTRCGFTSEKEVSISYSDEEIQKPPIKKNLEISELFVPRDSPLPNIIDRSSLSTSVDVSAIEEFFDYYSEKSELVASFVRKGLSGAPELLPLTDEENTDEYPAPQDGGLYTIQPHTSVGRKLGEDIGTITNLNDGWFVESQKYFLNYSYRYTEEGNEVTGSVSYKVSAVGICGKKEYPSYDKEKTCVPCNFFEDVNGNKDGCDLNIGRVSGVACPFSVIVVAVAVTVGVLMTKKRRLLAKGQGVKNRQSVGGSEGEMTESYEVDDGEIHEYLPGTDTYPPTQPYQSGSDDVREYVTSFDRAGSEAWTSAGYSETYINSRDDELGDSDNSVALAYGSGSEVLE